jgi:hypothetical protein
MNRPEPIADIPPACFKHWLKRQGWVQTDQELRGFRPFWTFPDPNNSQPWTVVVYPDRMDRNRETIEALAHIYSCQQWEIEAVLKVEPIVFTADGQPEAVGTIELFDQVERLDVGDGKVVELTDHNPASIKLDKDGADLLIAAIVSARYGWFSSVEAFGRGGGSFTLSIERIKY